MGNTDQEDSSNWTATTLKVIPATSFIQRLQGLIGRSLNPGEALLFKRSNALHTWFMGYNLDIIYVDRDFKIIRIETNLKPWSFSREPMAAHFLEIPSNDSYTLNIGDHIKLQSGEQ